MVTARPRRSVLYMPGSNQRALEKGRTLPADALILDLEDAVTPDAKAEARDRIAEAVGAAGYGKREIVVRVNALSTPWGYDDLAGLAGCGADAVLLPKVESAGEVRQAVAVLEENGAPEDLAVWCMMETPRGILAVAEIAAAHPRVACLVMGTSDLTKDLHANHTPGREPLMTSIGLCLLAARAHGLAILDGVHLDLDDEAGFAAACRQGRDWGFDGKTLIHPKTIAAANAAFGPSDDEIAWSRRIIAAHEEAAREGKGVVLVDGKLIENLHVAETQRLVVMAEMIAAMEREAAG